MPAWKLAPSMPQHEEGSQASGRGPHAQGDQRLLDLLQRSKLRRAEIRRSRQRRGRMHRAGVRTLRDRNGAIDADLVGSRLAPDGAVGRAVIDVFVGGHDLLLSSDQLETRQPHSGRSVLPPYSMSKRTSSSSLRMSEAIHTRTDRPSRVLRMHLWASSISGRSAVTNAKASLW